MQPLVLRTKEIAARYGYHPKTIHKWVDSKILPAKRINKRVMLFDVEECDRILLGKQK